MYGCGGRSFLMVVELCMHGNGNNFAQYTVLLILYVLPTLFLLCTRIPKCFCFYFPSFLFGFRVAVMHVVDHMWFQFQPCRQHGFYFYINKMTSMLKKEFIHCLATLLQNLHTMFTLTNVSLFALEQDQPALVMSFQLFTGASNQSSKFDLFE